MDNELFLILRPEGKVLQFSRKVQREISSHYNIYYDGLYPEIHITLDKIDKEIELDKTKEIIHGVCKRFRPVQIMINEFDCYLHFENNFLVLQVEKTESLLNFSRTLHKKLMEADISLIKNYQNWKFHITIISNFFAKNPLGDQKFQDLCDFFSGVNFPCVSEARFIELWRFTVDPSRKCIARFKLED